MDLMDVYLLSFIEGFSRVLLIELNLTMGTVVSYSLVFPLHGNILIKR